MKEFEYSFECRSLEVQKIISELINQIKCEYNKEYEEQLSINKNLRELLNDNKKEISKLKYTLKVLEDELRIYFATNQQDLKIFIDKINKMKEGK